MAKITREEVLKIAQMSKIKIWDHEIDQVIKDLESVLTYAERVSEIAQNVESVCSKNINVTREDLVSETDSKPILAQAPIKEDNYFVVPKILD